MNHNTFSAKQFVTTDTEFCAKTYSRMKFGCDDSAKIFGYELAEKFFEAYMDIILSNRLVVIPSPYNKVKNAATVMTEHFINKLNELIVEANGEHVEYSIIHRKVSYTNDYGFMTKEQRKGLIDNDLFYINKDFVKDKVLVFIDDVKITGTHEEKLKEILERESLDNQSFFLYYAEYFGDRPDIEAELNWASIKEPYDYLQILIDAKNHVIIRPIKYVLTLKETDLKLICDIVPTSRLEEIYYGCLAEGYYKIPSYQTNFQFIKNYLNTVYNN